MVAGNWKMNTTVAEGVALAAAVLERCSAETAVDVVVLPPFVHLQPVRDVLAGSRVRLGAQDVFWEDAGAYTGEVSAAMLADLCDRSGGPLRATPPPRRDRRGDGPQAGR